MTTKPYRRESGYRTYTYTCKTCDIVIKIEIHDKDFKKMKEIHCPLCKEKIK